MLLYLGFGTHYMKTKSNKKVKKNTRIRAHLLIYYSARIKERKSVDGFVVEERLCRRVFAFVQTDEHLVTVRVQGCLLLALGV